MLILMASDEELMERYQNGDSQAFDILYGRYSGKVYGYLRRRLGVQETTDDAYQVVFMKLHRSRSLYDPSLPFAPWIFMIARNVIIDVLRAAKRSLEDSSSVAIERAAAPEPIATPEIRLDGLPPTQREAVELRYLQEMPFEKIATKLGITETTARQWVSRGIRKLRKSWVG